MGLVSVLFLRTSSACEASGRSWRGPILHPLLEDAHRANLTTFSAEIWQSLAAEFCEYIQYESPRVPGSLTLHKRRRAHQKARLDMRVGLEGDVIGSREAASLIPIGWTIERIVEKFRNGPVGLVTGIWKGHYAVIWRPMTKRRYPGKVEE